MRQITVCKIEELAKAAQLLLKICQESSRTIVLLDAPMGSGKTTFVKYLLAELGGGAAVDSPTFSIVNDYKTEDGHIHHFDLYRLKDSEEAEEIGLWDYLDSGNLCLIEWPNIITELLPADSIIHVRIEVSLSQCREFSFSY